MADSSVRLTILMTLLLGFSHSQTNWVKATFSDTPNKDGIYWFRSNVAYMLQKGGNFQPTIKITLGSRGSFVGFNIGFTDSSGKLPDDYAPAPIEILLQANLLLYSRDGTFLGGTNLFYQSTSGLNLGEINSGHKAVDFYIDIPGCGPQRFTKSKSAYPKLLLGRDGTRGAVTTWNIVNHSSPKCPEAFGAIQFPTDQPNLDHYFLLHYRIEHWNNESPSKRVLGDFVVPSDENNAFYVANDDLAVGDIIVSGFVLG